MPGKTIIPLKRAGGKTIKTRRGENYYSPKIALKTRYSDLTSLI